MPRIKVSSTVPCEMKFTTNSSHSRLDSRRCPRSRSWSDDEYDSSSDDHLEELEAEEMSLLGEQQSLKAKLALRASVSVTQVGAEKLRENCTEVDESAALGDGRNNESEKVNQLVEKCKTAVPSAGDLIDEISEGIRLQYLNDRLDKIKDKIKRAQSSIKAKVLGKTRTSRYDKCSQLNVSRSKFPRIKTESNHVINEKLEKIVIKSENIKKEAVISNLGKIKEEKFEENRETKGAGLTEEPEPVNRETRSRSVKRKSHSRSPRRVKKPKGDSNESNEGKTRNARSRSRDQRDRDRSKSRESRRSQKRSARSKSRERIVSKNGGSASTELQTDGSASKSGERDKDAPRSRERPKGGARRSRSQERYRSGKAGARRDSRERRSYKGRSRSKERSNSSSKKSKNVPKSRSRSNSLKRSRSNEAIDRANNVRSRKKSSPGWRRTEDKLSKRVQSLDIMEKVRQELQEREQRTKALESRLVETESASKPSLSMRAHLDPPKSDPIRSNSAYPQCTPRPCQYQALHRPRAPSNSSYPHFDRFPQQNSQSPFKFYNGQPHRPDNQCLNVSPTEDPEAVESLLEEAEKKLELAFQKIPLAFPAIMYLQRGNTPLRLLIESLKDTSKIVNRGPDFNRTFILKDQILCVMEGNNGVFRIVVPFDKGRLMIQEVHRAYHDLTLTELEKIFNNYFTAIKELMTELNLVLWDCTMCTSKNLLNSELARFTKEIGVILKKICNVLPLISLIQLNDYNLKAIIDKICQLDTFGKDDNCMFRNGLLWRVSRVYETETVRIILPEDEIRSVVKQIHASYHKMSFQELERVVSEVFDGVKNARLEVSFVRLACPECCLKNDWDICSDSEKAFMKKSLSESLGQISKVLPFLSRVQREETALASVIDFLASNECEFKDSYTVKKNVLCQIVQEDSWVLKVVVPPGAERPLVQEMHRCYHDVSDEALEGILVNVFHGISDPQIEVNYARFVCDTCQREKKSKELCRLRKERDEKLANIMNRLSFDEKKRMENKLEKFMKRTERILRVVQEAQRHDRQLFDIITSLNGADWGIIMMKNDVLCQVVDSTTLQLKIVIPKNSEHLIVKRFHEYYHDVSDRKAIKILKKGFYKINKIDEKFKLVCESCPTCKGVTPNEWNENEDESKSEGEDDNQSTAEDNNWIELDTVEADADVDGLDFYLSNPDSNTYYGVKK